jgi:hypothetical protein
MRRVKRYLAATFATALMASGVAAPTASAQQSGLINVEITNVLNHNNIAANVPINAAANICGVTVAVLSANTANGQSFTCKSTATQTVTVRQAQ